MESAAAAPLALASGRRQVAVVVAIALIAHVVVRAASYVVLDDDGSYLLTAFAAADGGLPHYYHRAYLVMAWLYELVLGRGDPPIVLQRISAVTMSLAIVLIALSVPRRFAIVVALAVVASPGWWMNATRVEVHSVQFFGAALVLYVATRVAAVDRGRVVLRAVSFAAAVAIAVACHRGNTFTLPGACWIAARGRGFRRWSAVIGAGLIGWLLGSYANGHDEIIGGDFQSRSLLLVRDFWAGPKLAIIRDDFFMAWFPIVALALFLAPRDWRRMLPTAAAGLPAFVFFLGYGIPSFGGYYGTPMVFLAASVAVGASPTLRLGRRYVTGALFAFAVVAGLVTGVRWVNSDIRRDLEAIGEARLAVAAHLLPEGGIFIDLDLTTQNVSGRAPGLREVNVYSELMHRHHDGQAAADIHGPLIEMAEGHLAAGSTVVFDLDWRSLVPLQPILLEYLGPFEEHFENLPGTVRVQHAGGEYLVNRPAAASRSRSDAETNY